MANNENDERIGIFSNNLKNFSKNYTFFEKWWHLLIER